MNVNKHFPSVARTDEVELFEVICAVWKQKYLVLGVVLSVVLSVLAYFSFATQFFQVSSVLRPATLKDLQPLQRTEMYTLSPKEALLKVKSSIESYETRLGFFRAHEELFSHLNLPGQTLEQNFEIFNRDFISVSSQNPNNLDGFNDFLRLSFIYPKHLDGVAVLNNFVRYALDVEREKVERELMALIDKRLYYLNEKIELARANRDTEKKSRIASLLEADRLETAQLKDELIALRLQLKTQRNDRMAQLTEAITIANALGIKKPATPSSLTNAEVNAQQPPLYFMGTEVLEAERSMLKQRKSDDFTEVRIAAIVKELELLQVNREVEVLNQRVDEDVFLHDLEPLRSEVSRLSNLDFDISMLKLVTIDQLAFQPLEPIKPNKKLAFLLSLMLGLVLGTGLALIRYFVAVRPSSVSHSFP